MFKKVLATAAVLAMATSAAQAQTSVQVYNNTTTFTGYVAVNGGATSATGFTTLFANKITMAPYNFGGQSVTGVSFSIGNLNAASVAVSPTLEFYQVDPTSGGPGTLLYGVAFGAITVGATSVGTYTYTPSSGIFTIPTSGSFWIGETFTSSTATLAQLNNVGEGLYSPPSVGSTSDLLFKSSAPTQGYASNLAGTQYTSYYGGNPAAELGFSITATPEPSQYAAFGLGLLGLGGLALKTRRRSVVA